MIIFGGQGFIGSYLEGIKPDEDIRHSLHIPLCAIESRAKGQPIVNLACVQPARGNWSIQKYLETNTIGLTRILDWALGVKASKVLTVVSQKDTLKGEIGKLVITDHAVMDIMRYYHNEFGMQTIVLRLPPVYGWGPYLKGSGFMAFMENARDGKPIEVWGDPYVIRDWADVRDVAVSIVDLLEMPSGTYHIRSGRLSLDEEARIINQAWGNRSEIVYRPEIDNGLVDLSDSMAKTTLYFPGKRHIFEETVNEIKRRMENEQANTQEG